MRRPALAYRCHPLVRWADAEDLPRWRWSNTRASDRTIHAALRAGDLSTIALETDSVDQALVAPEAPRSAHAVGFRAGVRAIGERATSTLKTWRLLTKLRCCPQL
ncbi:hypothetical protein Vau01_113780 [Virgisporangium aurantiacum]|uniref:Uncharacterized protein n=1 Tax=Virgisporangium aurantiacum TaxID=175570 RepID=A0A8J3ZJ28_9ACTN|nr:hypothetical protein Vau01_113780 [Virgisporangium aurantiacum]